MWYIQQYSHASDSYIFYKKQLQIYATYKNLRTHTRSQKIHENKYKTRIK